VPAQRAGLTQALALTQHSRMNSTLKAHTGAKVLAVGFSLFAILRLADYFYYGQKVPDLVSAAAFALMAYGFLKNGGRDRPSVPGEPFDRLANWGLILGLLLGLGALMAKYIA